MIELIEKENGLLIVLIDKEELGDLITKPNCSVVDLLDSGRYLGNGWDEIMPDKIGALTDSPIIGFGVDWDDEGNIEDAEQVYWYPNYMVSDPFKELLEKGKVFFTKA